MSSFKANCRASLLVLILQLCSVSRTATLPALNLTYIQHGLSTPNLTLTYNTGYKPRAPDPYVATANTETVLFYDFGQTQLEETTIVILLYQMHVEYVRHMYQLDALVGTRDRVYSREGVTVVMHPNAKMTWEMFGNVWLLGGQYQENYQCVEMVFDITHSERVNVGSGEVRLN